MKYSNTKKLRKVKKIIEDILLFPIRCVCTPIYNLSKKYKGKKLYSDKQIRKTVQYLIDYWSDKEDEFYIIADDEYNPFDCSNVTNPYHMQADMSWGWSGENKRIKKKASHMYFKQKRQYITMFDELCGTPMTLDEKNKWFNKYDVNKIKDRIVYKIK